MANFGWRKTKVVTSEVTVATNNRWVATASHDLDSDSTVLTFDTDQPFDP